MLKSSKSPKIIDILTIIAAFAIVLYMTSMCPMASDDWHFKFVWRDFLPLENDTRVSSLSDIFESMKYYYIYSGGRVICHFLAYIFCNVSRWVFYIANSVVFVLLGLIINSIIRSEARYTPRFSLFLVYLSCFLFMPSFGDNFLWLSGSVNYLWPTVLMLFCIKLINTGFKELTMKKALMISIPVLISSATNEVTGGILGVFMLLTLAENRKKPRLYHVIPFISAIIGALIVVSAPGNSVRAAHIEKIENTDFSLLKSVMIKYSNLSLISAIWVLIILAVSVLFYFNKQDIIGSLCRYKYYITGCAGIMALSFSFSFTERPTLFGTALIVISVLISLFDIYVYMTGNDFNRDKLIRVIVLIILFMRTEYIGSVLLSILYVAALYAVLVFLYKFMVSRIKPRVPKQRKFFKGKKIVCINVCAFAAAALMLASFIYNFSVFNDNINDAKIRIDSIKKCIFELDLEKAQDERSGINGDPGIFFPLESYYNANSQYTVSWIAQYYGIPLDYSEFEEERAWN